MILYMLTGNLPAVTDPDTWFRAEHQAEPDFAELKDLVSKLIEDDPAARIGSRDATEHPWLH